MRLVEGLLGSTRFWALQSTVKTMGKRNFVQRGKKWCGWFDHHDSPFTQKLKVCSGHFTQTHNCYSNSLGLECYCLLQTDPFTWVVQVCMTVMSLWDSKARVVYV